MTAPRWEFWIDVGGTFTDCIAQPPDGSLLRCKLLSSGVTKGIVGQSSTDVLVIDGGRHEADDFWQGYRLRLLDENGNVAAESVVDSWRLASNTFTLAPPLPQRPSVGQFYELDSGEPAPIVAIRQLLGLRLDARIPPVTVRLGTTRGTNALLTRSGARTAFITTAGFGDILKIGYQNRPRLFDLAITKPLPLFERAIVIDERVSATGEVLVAPQEDSIREALLELRDAGIESLAVCLLHGYRFSDHEALIARIAHEVGISEVSVSHEVAPLIKLVSRGDTTVVDAYLNPVLRDYVATLRKTLGDDSDLRVLTSAGGLVTAERFSGKDSILSGPAGGVVGFSRAAQAAGFENAIGFDMGGTSTDVSRFDGRFELEYETEKAGVRIVTPMLAIETVAAGGGSLCWFDGVKLCVGPNSAGADPGPHCYGRGGPLTVTDINLFLGKLLPEHFPFPLLPRTAIEEQLRKLCDEVAATSGTRFNTIELADGFLQVANANMAKAIRSISIAKGYDPNEYVLVAFGGAAAQHACAIAEELGVHTILNHPDAGVMSALGAGMADIVRHRVRGVYRLYDEVTASELDSIFTELARAARGLVMTDLLPPKSTTAEDALSERITTQRSLDLRYQGLDAYLTIRQPATGDWRSAFDEEHRRLYGYVHEGKPLEIVAARAEAVGSSGAVLPTSSRMEKPSAAETSRLSTVYFRGRQHESAVYDRVNLQPGDVVSGPAIVLEEISTTVVDPGWEAEVLSGGELLLKRGEEKRLGEGESGGAAKEAESTSNTAFSPPLPPPLLSPSPILLEIFNNHFAAIAEQMGITLQNTSSSVNVKERLDFSCALFTAGGDLVVNAPHIPVHLGAMGATVKAIIADNPAICPGDVFVTNDPYRGGSHLPDVTVVTPVHDEPSNELRFFTASRAHHAEIGGITPGSMPPFSKNLAQEGVLIRNVKVVEAGESRIDKLRELLLAGPYPTRSVADNIADIAAQVAANRQGARDLLRLVQRYSWPVVEAYMRHIQEAAETKMRQALSRLPGGRREFIDHLDDGSAIVVAVTVDRETAKIDFTGTSAVVPGNLNANRAIVTAAVMYCLRCLIDEDIPLNQGVLAPVEIVLPECLLNPPDRDSPESTLR